MRYQTLKFHHRGLTAVLVIAGVFVIGSTDAWSQVDCVSPRKLSVSRVSGRVFDPFGALIPGVEVLLVTDDKEPFQTKTDSLGRFRFDAPPGRYVLKVGYPAFDNPTFELEVGHDVVTFIHPSTLRVILGLRYMYCSWVTTSKREFQEAIRANNKRNKEVVESHATQK